ncbi:MAG: hypothetical protein HY078_06650 [Elusimicrobia bacterium]|nr:hypothetical protein [Elusimicrobiota bacterium]
MKNQIANAALLAAVAALLAAPPSGAVGFEQEWGQGNAVLQNAILITGQTVRGAQEKLQSRPVPPPMAWDLFSGHEECRIVDSLFRRQPTLDESARYLRPCLQAVGRAQNAGLGVLIGNVGSGRPDLKGILITVDPRSSGNTVLLTNLNHTLAKRNHQLFGHPTIVSPAFEALSEENRDVVRPIEPADVVLRRAGRTQCRIVSKLSLKEDALGRPVASLSDDVEGVCTMIISPNPRTYILSEQGADGCGSLIYTGRNVQDPAKQIRVTDHRTRLCDDVIKNVIVVDESGYGVRSGEIVSR